MENYGTKMLLHFQGRSHDQTYKTRKCQVGWVFLWVSDFPCVCKEETSFWGISTGLEFRNKWQARGYLAGH